MFTDVTTDRYGSILGLSEDAGGRTLVVEILGRDYKSLVSSWHGQIRTAPHTLGLERTYDYLTRELIWNKMEQMSTEGDQLTMLWITHVNVVVRTKRDYFSKYDPKRSNHANFQLLKIKNKKVMTKKPQIFENTNPLILLKPYSTVLKLESSIDEISNNNSRRSSRDV